MIRGAGKVQVLLTVAAGEEYLYQTNSDISTSANGSEARTDTVTVTDSQRNDTGLLRQVNPPVYLGAVVVCQGADRAEVRLAIVEAVSTYTGLGADRISVLKMK
jgi:stage III sporulation protein AG